MSDERRLGEYRLLRKLGEGGFGEVWLADSPAQGGPVAIKIPTLPECAEALRREGGIQHALDHPNIVRTLAVHAAETPPYLVLEYVEGASLRERLRERGKLPAQEAVAILRQVLAAVAAAHAAGLVHRDLKPENVLLTPSGTAKVADFGLGVAVQTAVVTARLTTRFHSASARASIEGTYDYMSPEQRRGEAAEPRTDLYSCGILLYELLTGEAYPLRFPALGVAAGLSAVIEKAVARAAADRFSSALEMDAALRALRPGDAPAPAARRRLGGVGRLAAALAVGLAGLFVAVAVSQELEARRAQREATLRRHAEAGRQALTFGDWDAAERAFQQAVDADPTDRDARDGLARARTGRVSGEYRRAMSDGRDALARRAWAEAQAAFQRARLARPDDAEAVAAASGVPAARREAAYQTDLSEAEGALARGEWETAEAAFRKAGEERPEEPGWRGGVERVRSGRAELAYSKAFQEAQRSVERKDWTAAAAAFERALAVRPGDRAAAEGLAGLAAARRDADYGEHLTQAEAALARGGWEDAANAFGRAGTVWPEDPRWRAGLNRVRVAKDKAQPKPAGADREVALGLGDDGGAAAVQEFQRTVASQFERATAALGGLGGGGGLGGLGGMEGLVPFGGGRPARADAAARDARRALADGDAALAGGRWEEAEAAYRRAGELQPKDAAWQTGLAKARAGRDEAAYREAMDVARAAMSVDRRRAARRALDRALRLRPEDAAARARREQIPADCPPDIFYRQDFSGVAPGKAPFEWTCSDSLVVREADGRRFVVPTRRAQHSLSIPTIVVPEDFRFELTVVQRGDAGEGVRLRMGELDLRFDLAALTGTRAKVGLSGQSAERPAIVGKLCTVALEKQGGVVRTLLDGEEFLLVRPAGLRRPDGLALSFEVGEGALELHRLVGYDLAP